MRIRFTIPAALVCIFSLFVVLSVQADTISLASVGTATDPGQFNSNGDTISIVPDALYAAALPGSSWVSFAQTTYASGGPGYLVVPNGTTVSFFDVFNVTGTPTGGTITVLADDTATVMLNGVTLPAPTADNTSGICSASGINCVVQTVVSLPASDLQTGSNTLEFDVTQLSGGGFGLDYSGSVTYTADQIEDPVDTPEPGLAMLLSFGLLMAALVISCRRSVTLSE
jgi:hypothetical protein